VELTQEELETKRKKDIEEMNKISLDALRTFDVETYSEEFCRYALRKIIHKYWDYKREADRYKEDSHRYFLQVKELTRHFKICENCFAGTWYARGKKSKSKIVKGVHDRGHGVDQAGQPYDNGWVCAKHKAHDEELTKRFGPVVTKVLVTALEIEQKTKPKPKQVSECEDEEDDNDSCMFSMIGKFAYCEVSHQSNDYEREGII
jgi:hypothetical protein